MKRVINAITLALSVSCLTVFIICTRKITLETPIFSKYMLNAIVYGWVGLYLLRLYWKESEVDEL